MSQKSTFFNSILSSLALVISDDDVIKTASSITDSVPFGKLALQAGTAIVKGLAPEVAGHFTCQLSYEKLKKRFTHPTELNHYLSEAIKPAFLQSYSFIERMYLESLKEKFADDVLIEQSKEHLEMLQNDLKHWLKDEILEKDFLDQPADALQIITDRMFLYGGFDENDENWVNLRQYFKDNLYNWFDLAFKEALYENDNALKSFQKYLLEEIREQNRENNRLLEEIKAELALLTNNQKGKSSDGLKQFLKVEIQKIYDKLNLIHKDINYLIDLVKKLRKEFLEKQTPPKTTQPLTDIPALGMFIGREDDLKKLTETLETSQHVVLVNGIGGIGKTTLAKAYVEARKADFDHIAWINVLGNSTQEAFVNTNYIDDALNQAKFTQGDTDARFGAIMKVLKQLQGKGLLVIDNAETDIEDISQDLPTFNWKVLLTSRDNLDGYQTIPLDELSPTDALVLFRTYYKGKASDHDLHALLKTIDYHTLMIELLAKTLEKSDDEFDLAELQDKLTKRQLDDERLARTIKTEHRNAKQTQLFKHLLATFELSEKHRSPYEIWVLKQFAALPPEPQAIKTLREWLKIEDENSKKAFAQAIENLHTTGWLRKTRNDKGETCYTLHRLIQDMVQYQHPIGYEDIAALIDTFVNLLHFDSYTNFTTKFQYLSPAETVLNSLPEKVENSQIAFLSNNLGITYLNFADFKKAVKYLEKALSIYQNQKEEENTSTTQSNLAVVYRNLGEYTKAADLGENALKSDIKNFGESNPRVAVIQSNLAEVYRNLGDYTRAAGLLERALKSNIQNFGESHPDVARCQSILALVYRNLGEYIKAANLGENALKSDINNFGESHPKVATRQSNLALVYQNIGEYNKAADLLKNALQSDIQNFGESHPNVAIDQGILAGVLVDLNQLDEAYILLEKAYATFVLRLGTEHPATKNCLSWLNGVKGMLG